MGETDTIDGAAVVTLLRAAAESVIAAEPLLTKADQQIGDGDHGIGMARGFKAALQALDKLGTETGPKAAFSAVGTAVLSKAGGASGAVFGTLFLGAAKGLGPDPLDASALAEAVQAGAEAVMARGKAKAGDKTMLDALLPAAAALKAQASAGLGTAVAAAATAAAAGAEETAGMLATMGRAKQLGERARGHVDPGALSVRFLFAGMAEAMGAAPRG